MDGEGGFARLYIYIYIKIYILSSACYEMSHYFELASDSTRLHG
jgi:hypothetical protein